MGPDDLTDADHDDLARRAEEIDRLSDAMAPTGAFAAPSALPHDAERPSDARYLLSTQRSPLEYLSAVYCGIEPYDRGRVEAAKATLAYYHAPRTSKQQVELTGDAAALTLGQALRLGGATRDDVDRIRAELRAVDAERLAAKPH